MTGTSPESIARFFVDHKIDAFCIADAAIIRAPDGRHPRNILPFCRTIILFGVVMPDRFFSGTEQEQADATKHLTRSLESAARALNDLLEGGGSPSAAIFPSLPLKVEDGKLRGRLSLKHCARDAGFGMMGENTLLLHPVHGNRLALAAVITEMEIASSLPLVTMPAFTHCRRCVAACPAGAIHDGGIDLTSCRNLTDYIPRPLSWRLMKGRWSARFVTMLLNGFGAHVAIRATCTACVTACPYFHKGER